MSGHPPTGGITRRSLLAAAAAVPLAGCEGPFGLSYGEVKTALAISTGLEPAPGITLEQAAAVRFASLGYRLDGSAEEMLVLATKSGEELLWTSSERRAMTTAGGRIVNTAGFKWNLTSTTFIGQDPLLIGLNQVVPTGEVARLTDFQDIYRFGVTIRSRFESAGNKSISILGAALPTRAFVEHCECDELDWTFSNAYWTDDETGFVWRSRQSLHPNLAPIEFEILRPPA